MRTHREHEQGESTEGIEPMPLQHSHLHHLPPANHNLKKFSNRRQEASAFLCKLPLNMKLNTTTYNKATPRRKASFAIFYLLSPHGKGFHASLQKAEGRGATVTTCHDQSHFNIRPSDLVLLITKREFPRNGVAPGWWKNFDGLSGAGNQHHMLRWGLTQSHLQSFILYILCTMDARYNILEQDGKGILDDRSIARCTQVWRNKNAATGKAAFMAFKDSVLHGIYNVLTCFNILCIWSFLVSLCKSVRTLWKKAILKPSKTALPSCDLMVTLCWRSAKAILAWSHHPPWWIPWSWTSRNSHHIHTNS